MRITLQLNDGELVAHHTDEYPDLRDGMTLRQTLATLRATNWGDMGGTHELHLSDGSFLCVELRPAYGGGNLLNSQRVRRYVLDHGAERTIRHYAI